MPAPTPPAIETLFDNYFNQQLTAEELAQLEHWILESPDHADAFARAGLTHGLTREQVTRKIEQWKARKKPMRFSAPMLLAAGVLVAVVGIAMLVPELGVAKKSARFNSKEASPASPMTMAPTPAPMAEITRSLAADAAKITGADGANPRKTAGEPAAPAAIIRTASLRLRANDAYATAKQVEELANALGGFVAQNQCQGEARQAASALVEIRIPAHTLDQARAKIRTLGLGVLADFTSAQEVSAQLVDLKARITNLETAEKELRQIVSRMGEKTDKTSELMTAYRELTQVREQIETLRAQEKNIQSRVALSSLTVEIFESPPPPSTPEGWSAARPFQSAWVVLINLGQTLWSLGAYLLVVGLPLLLLFGGPSWLIYRAKRRGRME